MTDLPRVCVAYLLRTGPDGGREVLLGRKRTGLGTGRIVGPGGKLEAGESAEAAIIREIAEEVGLDVDPAVLQHRGDIRYHFPHRPAWSQRSTVFVVESFAGVVRASDELDPAWFAVDAVPYAQMWDDARRWLPGVLSGGRVDAEFTFGEDLSTVVD
jgi:8-oxo-dGTP diphosphatase